MGGSGGTPPGRVRPRGNIEELASGSLRVRVYAGVDVLTGRELYLRELVPAGRDAWLVAERVRDELLRQVREGRQPRTNASLAQLLAAHLAASPVQRRVKETQLGYVRKHVGPLLGERPIGGVTAGVLDAFYAELRRCREHCDGRPAVAHHVEGAHRCDRRCRAHVCRPLAAWTVRQIHYLISGAYQSAIRWEWVIDNPTRRARQPAAPPPDPQPPTADEAARLLQACWRAGFGPLVWLAMTTGARRGELCALRWGNLQVQHAERGRHECLTVGCRWQLVIRRGIGQGHDGQLWETDTKTHQRRHIALDPETVTILLEHRQRCEQDAAQLGVTLTDEHFIFAGAPDGSVPCKPSTVSQRYRRCAQRLGIKTRLHHLRHYSATELISAGVDIRTVAGRLGHAGGGTTTLKVYAAWVAAADQHASTLLMNRMPHRPPAPLAPLERAKLEPRWPHERIAATLHTAWQDGTLPAGSELTVHDIAGAHGVSVGTAHRAITLLSQWGVLTVRNGRPSLVCPTSPGPAAEADQASVTQLVRRECPPPAAEPRRQVLTLELLHLGRQIRRLRAQADPDDFDALQRLMIDAVRRTGVDRSRLGEYEMNVHLADGAEPVATVVVAA